MRQWQTQSPHEGARVQNLDGSEAWIPNSHQERRLNSFHLRCLRHILGITWRDSPGESTSSQYVLSPEAATSPLAMPGLVDGRRSNPEGHSLDILYSYAVRMSASKTSSPSTSTLSHGNMLLRIVVSGSRHSTVCC